jgi:hypothetical protein
VNGRRKEAARWPQPELATPRSAWAISPTPVAVPGATSVIDRHNRTIARYRIALDAGKRRRPGLETGRASL